VWRAPHAGSPQSASERRAAQPAARPAGLSRRAVAAAAAARALNDAAWSGAAPRGVACPPASRKMGSRGHSIRPHPSLMIYKL